MRELSIFVDESGSNSSTTKYRIMTLVFHDQDDDLAPHIAGYERSLQDKGLPDIQFHASPLIYGKDEYKPLDHETRHRMFSSFYVFLRALPVAYKAFTYKAKELNDSDKFIARLKRDFKMFLADNLEYFQSFDRIKIYYDNGQHAIYEALHGAIDEKISKQAILYKMALPSDYRLAQVADFLCTLELAAIKYENHEDTPSDEKIFGSKKNFKRNYLRLVRRKLLDRS